MRWNSRIIGLGFALTVVSLLALPALAASPVADVLLGGGQVEWVPASEFAGLKLTVSGPEGVSELAFGPGENPRFDLAALTGHVDGIYTWELTARPLLDQATTRALAEARVKGEDGNRTRPSSLPPRESLIQTGSFRVVGGAIVQPAEEGAADGARRIVAEANRVTAADQVIPDDLIVQMSLCVGFDCVNNENFGFDTIRLKENNLRIHFLDTSVGSFPSNDWRLVANDSASGGRNVFYLEDSTTGREVLSVAAAAPSNSLWISGTTGHVGFGTSTPVLQLHIKDGNTPGVRLEQDTSSGFTAQTWDIAGNEANFFVRSASTGSQLPFRVRPGAPSSSIDIAASGNVGIGTASPANPLHVLRNSASFVAALNLENSGGDVGFRLENALDVVDVNLIDSGTGNELRINFGASPAELTLQADGDLIITGTYTPDYVFEDDYPLLTLDQLAGFIAENGHLPNVPSDAEVRSTGRINLSEFQLRLLEKIEELTLYTLDQHRQIQGLMQQVDDLRAASEVAPEVVTATLQVSD